MKHFDQPHPKSERQLSRTALKLAIASLGSVLAATTPSKSETATSVNSKPRLEAPKSPLNVRSVKTLPLTQANPVLKSPPILLSKSANEQVIGQHFPQFADAIKAIYENSIPLEQQLSVLRQWHQKGGEFAKRLNDPHLTEREKSTIVAITNVVSSRLTLAFSRDNERTNIEKYFNIDLIRKAGKGIQLEIVNKPPTHCNVHYALYKGSIIEETAEHCLYMPEFNHYAKNIDGYFLPRDRTDTAMRPLSSDEARKVAGALDFHEGVTNESVMGRPIVLRWIDFITRAENIFFSIAMQAPPAASDGRDLLMITLPPWAGQVVKRDANGKVLSIRASGASGAAVAVRLDSGQMALAGSLSAVEWYADPCLAICVPTGLFAAPDAHRLAFEAERKSRVNTSSPASNIAEEATKIADKIFAIPDSATGLNQREKK